MLTNLFTIFDSSTLIFNFNWLSTMFILILFPHFYWMFNSRFMNLFKFLMKILVAEFKIVMKFNFNINNLIYFITLFVFIMFNNFMGLFSYIFTSTSHLSFSLIFSLSMWFSLMIFGWMKNMNFMFSHLVPQGTPFILMFFMVFIELLSNIIRPLTLCIRLTANMIAGHLLITLLSMFIPKLFLMYSIILLSQMLLLILEMAVSIIQSYVFIILLILYMKETN